MTGNREGQVEEIPIDQRVITQQAQSTIRTLQDALVELITNSDDSYRRLEALGVIPQGSISIEIHRRVGGKVSFIQVTDFAEGMDLDTLLQSLTFGGDHSGFTSGQTLRGLFGKGYKEAIFSLGHGTIRSTRNGNENAVSIAYDRSTGKYQSTVEIDTRPTVDPDGTIVSIQVSNERITSPTWPHLQDLVRKHFALRDICATPNRSVTLILKDGNLRHIKQIQYDEPSVNTIVSQQLDLGSIGAVDLTVEESETPLDYTRNDPCSIAGLIVRTEGIPLDNRAFGMEREEALPYFTGSIEVPSIAEAIRNRDFGLVDPSRSGLNWKDERAKALNDEVERILREQIQRKQRELEGDRRRAMNEQHRRRLRDLCALLNQLAEDEIEDVPPYGPGGPMPPGLVMKPEEGHARPGENRRFTVYLPRHMIGQGSMPRVAITLDDIIGDIWLSNDSILLKPHTQNTEILVGNFYVRGKQFDNSCTLFAAWEDQEDLSEFRVMEPGKSGGGEPPRPRGLFREIVFDDQETSPLQRVSFNHGEITIFLNFPPTQRYLRSGGEGMDTPQGSLMCAELVAEAFGRELARRRIEQGIVIALEGGEIDAYNSELNNLSRKYLGRVHAALVDATI